jgi:UDP-galactopyranose mutase
LRNGKKIDYLIVGSGFFGSICARELTDSGFKCLVIEKRKHIGGNCYTEKRDNINIHSYGPHIFHTSDDEVWKWINRYTKFNNFVFTPVANYKGEIFSLPFNMWTFNKLWNVKSPEDAKRKIKSQSNDIGEPKNLEEQAIKLVGKEIYEKLIKGYTSKQWKKDPKELPKEIIKRLPVRFTYNNNYFDDKYQGIPIDGYNKIFERLLDGIDVKLGVDFLTNKLYWENLANKIIYTGPIDRYYDYRFGELEYKTTEFIHERKDEMSYQGTPAMYFTDIDTPYTRIIEHKHFEDSDFDSDVTWITYEFPTDYFADKSEPYYPVNDYENNIKYSKYRELSEKQSKVIFGGRLAEYKYYDMHQVIKSALNTIKDIISKNV